MTAVRAAYGAPKLLWKAGPRMRPTPVSRLPPGALRAPHASADCSCGAVSPEEPSLAVVTVGWSVNTGVLGSVGEAL